MEINLPYQPHLKQSEVHLHLAKNRIVAAGRGSGKTVLAINELIKGALLNPGRRSWYIAPTYEQAKNIAWRDPQSGIFRWLPQGLIKRKKEKDLFLELVNGHIIELKGSDKYDSLRGARLIFAVLDEYGFMKPEVWESIIRPMLIDQQGKALFIGTPAEHGGSHFKDLWDLGQIKENEENYKSWLFYSIDNTKVENYDAFIKEIEEAKRTMPEDIFKREYEADFTISQGLVYPEFNYGVHVVPEYQIQSGDILIGSIDPGIRVPTACIWSAWNQKEGTGVFFDEFYQTDLIADEAAQRILSQNSGKNISYWVIDKSSRRREYSSPLTLFGEYQRVFGRDHTLYAPIYRDDESTVRGQINAIRTMLKPDPKFGPKIHFTRNLIHTIDEIRHYQWYEYRENSGKNPREQPRKFKDHLMDCVRNTIVTKPWLTKSGGIKFYVRS